MLIPGITAGSFPAGAGGGTPEFTEAFWEWNNASGDAGWNTDFSVSGSGAPANSVAVVMCMNADGANEEEMGVRNTSSSLARFIDINEGEGGGVSGYTACVNVDGSQQIDYYAETISADSKFVIIGYWTNITYTETFPATFLGSGSSAWVERTLSAANVIMEVACMNTNATGRRQCGVRAKGSSLTRWLRVDKAESGGVELWTSYANTDGSSVLEFGADTLILGQELGYFDQAELTYTELTALTLTHSGTGWTLKDLDTNGVPANALAHIVSQNTDGTNEKIGGVREVGSSLERRITIRKGEANGEVCQSFAFTKTDSSSDVNLYADDITGAILTKLLGYWEIV